MMLAMTVGYFIGILISLTITFFRTFPGERFNALTFGGAISIVAYVFFAGLFYIATGGLN